MTENGHTGQDIAKLLALVGALLSGEPIDIVASDGGDTPIADESSSVEVIGIERDNWPDAPVTVKLATADGHRTVPLADVEIVACDGGDTPIRC